jgi:hypothetical protein
MSRRPVGEHYRQRRKHLPVLAAGQCTPIDVTLLGSTIFFRISPYSSVAGFLQPKTQIS